MDCEAEATIARVYCNFQNRKYPLIKPKIIPKINPEIQMILSKDGVVPTRNENYNYMDKQYIQTKVNKSNFEDRQTDRQPLFKHDKLKSCAACGVVRKY